ncbi:MAG: ECF RNA polymerase sigma factor SigK [Haloechinothrix sp.]
MHGGPHEQARRRPGPVLHAVDAPEPEVLMASVALGDEAAFARLYDLLSDRIFGLILRVMRDPAQSEEVAQEVFVELWRTASRYQRDRGSVIAWSMTLAHRRAVDRVRSAQSAADREVRVAAREYERPFDAVADEATGRLERQQVRRCLDSLTPLQHESVSLAYYQGYTYGEVARLLDTPLGTIKTRLRDGLIRLRDCLGVTR